MSNQPNRIICTVMAFLSATALCHASDLFEQSVRKNNTQAILENLPDTENVDIRGTNGKTALMIAARAGDEDLVESLLQRGADVNAENINGGTPIMFAAISGNRNIIERLISAGGEVNQLGANGWGALMIAVAKNHSEATRLLLQSGADINTRDIYLWTPIMRAAFENRLDVVALLLQYDELEINLRDDHGATALHHAASQGHQYMVNLLLKHGADSHVIDIDGMTPADYADLAGYANIVSEISKFGSES